jgi:hypothetical protein
MTSLANRHPLLKLKAADEEDLKVVSAQVQDALVPIADMAYLAEERAFVMVVNRFMWEHALSADLEAEAGSRDGSEDDRPVYLRTNCGLRFAGVRAVRYRGLDRSDRRLVLELLALEPAEGGLALRFAGDADVWLECDGIDCRMQDLDEPWPTRHRPHHAPEPDSPQT